jgi:prefoldin subunit 5
MPVYGQESRRTTYNAAEGLQKLAKAVRANTRAVNASNNEMRKAANALKKMAGNR